MKKSTSFTTIDDSDSFLDVITNLIGVLTLVAAVIALNLKDVSLPFGTPITRHPPKKLKRINVYCKNGKALIIQPSTTFVADLEAKVFPEDKKPQWSKLVDATRDNPVNLHGFHIHATYSNSRSRRLFFQIKALENTEHEQVIDLDAFLQSLNKYNPEKEYLYFFVDQNDFALFRHARDKARELGFQTGFFPGDYPELFYDLDSRSKSSRIPLLND